MGYDLAQHVHGGVRVHCEIRDANREHRCESGTAQPL